MSGMGVPGMLDVAGSAVLAVLNLLGLVMIARRRRRGWLVLLAADLAALPYQALTWQFGFLATGVVSVGVAWGAYMDWGRVPGRHRGRHRVIRQTVRRRRKVLAATLVDGTWTA